MEARIYVHVLGSPSNVFRQELRAERDVLLWLESVCQQLIS
jgi:hypothetical protein